MKRWLVFAVLALAALFALPRLLDRQAPVVTEELWRIQDPAVPTLVQVRTESPTGALRGQPQLDLRVADAHLGPATVTIDGVFQEFTFEDGVLRANLQLDGLSDGMHVLTLTLEDRAWPPNRTQVTRALETDATPPNLSLARSSRRGAQGRTLALFARADEPILAPTARFGDKELAATVLDDAATLRALVGVPVGQEAGAVPVVIEARDEAGNLGRWEGEVIIKETAFPSGGVVTLAPQKQTDMMDKAKGKESNDKRAAAYAAEVDVALPSEPMRMPVEGRVSSAFGKVRRYNTGVVRHHLGTDLAASSGTPVHAAAGGVVVLAELLHIYGNAVILRHGDSVSTSYNHLSRIDVKVGDVVQAGDVVGAVGSTGQSTGPHLHWGMVVAGEAVAAEQWTERRFDLPLDDDFDLRRDAREP